MLKTWPVSIHSEIGLKNKSVDSVVGRVEEATVVSIVGVQRLHHEADPSPVLDVSLIK